MEFLTKAVSLNVIPKGFRIKAPFPSYKSKIIIDRAMRSLIKDRIKTHRSNSDTFVRNSTHFVSIVKTLNLTKTDLMVSFDVVNLFPSVPVDKTLNIVRALLEGDHTLSDRTLPVDGILESLCLCKICSLSV